MDLSRLFQKVKRMKDSMKKEKTNNTNTKKEEETSKEKLNSLILQICTYADKIKQYSEAHSDWLKDNPIQKQIHSLDVAANMVCAIINSEQEYNSNCNYDSQIKILQDILNEVDQVLPDELKQQIKSKL